MKRKQVVGIIVACLAILIVGMVGVLTNTAKEEETESAGFFESLMMAGQSYNITLPMEEFVGVVEVVGEIGPTTTDVLGNTVGYNHNQTMDFIDMMMYSDVNKGILLYIDSPGGTVYESDELYLKLMEYKEVTDRPVWAYFASEACSGGYYVAMAADKIYANRNGWTGSIGVVISFLNCKGLYDNLGIEEIDITSGKNKAMGAAGAEVTEEQYAIFQSLVDEAYDQFVGIVAEGRDMDEARVRELADGRIYSAMQAKEVDLLDKIGSYEECVSAFCKKEKLDEFTTFYAPERTGGVFGSIYGMLADLKPKSETEIATEILDKSGNGVLKYYAK